MKLHVTPKKVLIASMVIVIMGLMVPVVVYLTWTPLDRMNYRYVNYLHRELPAAIIGYSFHRNLDVRYQSSAGYVHEEGLYDGEDSFSDAPNPGGFAIEIADLAQITEEQHLTGRITVCRCSGNTFLRYRGRLRAPRLERAFHEYEPDAAIEVSYYPTSWSTATPRNPHFPAKCAELVKIANDCVL